VRAVRKDVSQSVRFPTPTPDCSSDDWLRQRAMEFEFSMDV
jgi:hypothetical protein